MDKEVEDRLQAEKEKAEFVRETESKYFWRYLRFFGISFLVFSIGVLVWLSLARNETIVYKEKPAIEVKLTSEYLALELEYARFIDLADQKTAL